MATINVTDENFDQEVVKAKKPVIVDFDGQSGVDRVNRLVQY